MIKHNANKYICIYSRTELIEIFNRGCNIFRFFNILPNFSLPKCEKEYGILKYALNYILVPILPPNIKYLSVPVKSY